MCKLCKHLRWMDGRTDGWMDGISLIRVQKFALAGPRTIRSLSWPVVNVNLRQNSFSQPLQIYITVHLSIHFFTADGSKPASYSVHVHQGFVPLGFVWKLGRLHPDIPDQQRRKTYAKPKDLAVFPTGQNPPKHHMVGSCTTSTKKTYIISYVCWCSFYPLLVVLLFPNWFWSIDWAIKESPLPSHYTSWFFQQFPF